MSKDYPGTFSPGLHTTTHLRHAIFQPYANRHLSSHTDSMNDLQYRNVAKCTIIRTRFKILTSIEQAKLRMFKKCSMMLKRGKDPIQWEMSKKKILLCIYLSAGIQMDNYEPIDISNLYVLLFFYDKFLCVRLGLQEYSCWSVWKRNHELLRHYPI